MEESEIVAKDELFIRKYPMIKAGIDFAFEENERIISSIPNPVLLCSPFIILSTTAFLVHLLRFTQSSSPNKRWIHIIMWFMIYGTLNMTAVSMISFRRMSKCNNSQEFSL